MQHDITTMEDVKSFIEQIAGEIEDFHPLADFTDYVYPDSYMRRYSDSDADIRNSLLDKCFNVCAKHTEDFYSYLIWYFELQRACMTVEQE